MTSRKCEQCKHFIIAKAGEGKIYGCDRSKCVFEPTTKNDLPHCQYTDEEIAKSFIEDVEAVKDQLPCGQMMDFPNTFDEFAKDYGFKDKKEIYTNGSELIPVFRVKQWLEHISTTKNDLGVDCISRADAIQAMQNKAKKLTNEDTINGLCGAVAILFELPSVTPQEPTEKIHSKTCGTCKHFRKHRNEKNIEICKELYGENIICGHCTYWEEPHEVAFPTTEYDYCSHYREVEE